MDICFRLEESTSPDFRRFLFLFVLFFVRIWFAKALFLTIFPDPVVLNLLAAPRFVFIFGILFSPSAGISYMIQQIPHSVSQPMDSKGPEPVCLPPSPPQPGLWGCPVKSDPYLGTMTMLILFLASRVGGCSIVPSSATISATLFSSPTPASM